MASDEASLRALEALMTEFFAPSTTNGRKREIEDLLNNFSQQRDAWKHSLYFMSHTSNEYVMMYCMTMLENLINRQWIGLVGEDKMEIRGTLNRFLLSHHDSIPTFIRNKLVKLVVDIGRLDWPHFYPDFFSSILQLVQQNSTAPLGLILLQTTSEELACPREDLSIARKEELHRLLLQQVPTVLNILNNMLDSILEKHQNLVTATPPPSPTHGQSAGSPARTPMSLISASPIQSNSFLSQMFKSPNSRVQTESLPPLDTASHQLSVLALNCLAHLFSWIPLSSTITPSLLSTIFHFAGFGCEVNTSHGTSSPAAANSSFSASRNESLGVLAMCCINELLSKNCVPVEFEDFLLQMFQQTFYLLQRLTKDSATGTSGNRLTDIEDSYVEKFTEFLRLFVSIHLRRFEGNAQFPMLDFLSLLLKYTFKQPSSEGFFNCLDIWTIFLDYLSTKRANRQKEGAASLESYKEALVTLVTHILQKLQFRYNHTQLVELDDETTDDDDETEWQSFLRQCLETVAKVAELLPEETFQRVYQPFQENIDVYMGLEPYVTTTPNGIQLNITSENQCRRLHCTLRDLSSLLQALGRLAEHFIGDNFMGHFADAHMLMERLISACAYGTKTKLYEVQSVAGEVLQADFIEVHAQAMATIKANASWLSRFYVESLPHPEQRQKCATMISSMVDTVAPLFKQMVPSKVSHSAAHLLLSLMTTVRASFLLQLKPIQDLYNDVSRGVLDTHSSEVQLLLYRSLSLYLLLPWPNQPDADQDWAMRATNHNSLIKHLTADYSQIKDLSALAGNKPLQQEVKPVIKKTLSILTDLVDQVSTLGVTKSKQLCYQSLQESVNGTLLLLPVFINQPDVMEDILGFFLALLEGLKTQMGMTFIEQTLQVFMTLYTREQLAETILHEGGTGHKVIEKFLKIFEVIVREPGSGFRAFLPNIITISMEQIYPIVAERPSPDIKSTLYRLLFELLQNNWRYFFKSNVLAKIHSQNDEVYNEHQFIAIMQAFGQSFLQPDIDVFRQNLESLENLNSKLKLYHKKIFRELMLMQFLNVLLQVLLHKSHDLLAEEIGITVYNMAAVDFDAFYATFLPQFLSSCEGLDQNQRMILGSNFKMDKDLPSFTQSIHRFANDLRYYRLCNSSLPEGSVKL